MTYREASRKLRAIGCHELPRRGSGSHRKWHNPATGKANIPPDWSSKDLKTGTLHAAVAQLGIEWQAFTET